MNPIQRTLGTGLLLAFLAIVGCKRSEQPSPSQSAREAAPAKPTVYVVNYPLQYFAERVAGDTAEIIFPAPPDEDPAYWKPDADTIASYQQADLILLNGATYAKWVRRITLPRSRMVDTSRGFVDQYIAIEEAVKHAHGPDGEHAHAEVAFTTWLDPTLALRQVEAICSTLTKVLPNHAPELLKRCEALKSELKVLDTTFQEITKNHSQQTLLASHPVYQYFARRYKLNIKSLHWEPDEVPDAKQWARFDELVEGHKVQWMLWEAPPNPDMVEQLRNRGVNCLVFSPCGNTAEDGNYLQVMSKNAEELKHVFE